MLYPYLPGKGCPFTFNKPWSQRYPPPPLPPPPPPPPQGDLSALVSTSICIIGSALLFLFLTVFLYLYIIQSRRSSPAAVAPVSTNRRQDENNGEERDLSGYHHHVWRITTSGLQRSAIDSITVVGFKKGEGLVDCTDCSVCLSEFEQDEELRVLPKCSHAFHISCIDTWLLSHKNCPLCRSPVFPTEPRKKKETERNINGEEEESSGSRRGNVLPRSQSDLATRHCGGTGRLEGVRRSFSIGGGSLFKGEGSDDVAGRSRRQFYTSFSANFFSSSRRSRNQDSVLPTRMPC